VNDGELPGVGDGEGVSDGVQKRSENSERSSGCSIASSRRGERRLEKARTTVTFGSRSIAMIRCRHDEEKLVREERQRKIRERGGNRRRGDASLHGNRRGLAAALRSFGEELRGLAVLFHGKAEGKARGGEGFI
jgi:hypothetical protein